MNAELEDKNQEIADAQIADRRHESTVVVELRATIKRQADKIEELERDNVTLSAGLEGNERQREIDQNHFALVEKVKDNRIAELEQAARWIPVGERLPKTKGYYMFCDEDYAPWIEYFDPFWRGIKLKATHWRPLPTPPEVQS